MDDYHKKQQRARRQERKVQRLGRQEPTCVNCRMTNLEALTTAPASSLPQWFLERHHVAGRAASDLTITLCRNCHAVLTDWQEDWHKRLRRPTTPTERLAAFLQGLADWFWALARSLSEVAGRIEAYVRWLLEGMEGPAPAFGEGSA